jgi:glutaredoxin 2
LSNSDNSIQQLTETVKALTVALAQSERRYQSIEGILRWAGVIFLCFALVFFYVTSNLVSKAYAVTESQDVLTDIKNVLTEFNKTLKDTSTLIQRIKEDSDALRAPDSEFSKTLKDAGILIQRIKEDSDVLRTKDSELSKTLKDAGTLIQGMAAISTSKEFNQTLKDSSILIRRIKEDSDGLRNLYSGVINELHTINRALLSVPAMAAEMREMNFHMMIMAHDTDSTMGRAGRMMPGW